MVFVLHGEIYFDKAKLEDFSRGNKNGNKKRTRVKGFPIILYARIARDTKTAQKKIYTVFK